MRVRFERSVRTVVLVVGALVMGSVAATQIGAHSEGPSPGVVHACVDKGGDVKIVGESEDCKGTRTALDWQTAGPQVSFYAFNSVTDTVATTAFEVVEFDSVLYDDGSNFDTSEARFVAPASGVYHFDAYVELDDVGEGVRVAVSLRRGPSDVFLAAPLCKIIVNAADRVVGCGGSALVDLNAGEHVEVIARAADADLDHKILGAFPDDSTGGSTFFSGYQVY